MTEKASEAMFVRSKERLFNKFEALQEKEDRYTNKNQSFKYIKDPVLNLASDQVLENHKELLCLGPKFVPHVKEIPYMDIVSTTESSALKLEYDKKKQLVKHRIYVKMFSEY